MSESRVSSWASVDLAKVLEVAGDPVRTRYLGRSDGVPLLYGPPSYVHVFNGEPGSCKSMAALAVASEIIRDEPGMVHYSDNSPTGLVLYLDFEKSAAVTVRTLLAMDVTPKQIREGLIYVRPTDPYDGGHQEALWRAIERGADVVELVVIDGVDAALSLNGFDPNKAADIARWWNLLVRPLQEKCWGPVLLVDHVPKSRDGRGDYSGGSYRKKADVDGAQFGFEVVSKFGQGKTGVIRMKLQKDCHGYLEQYAGSGGEIAQLRLTSDAETGRIEYQFRKPLVEPPAQDGAWRPTGYMQRVSLILEKSPKPLSQNAVVTAAGGKATYVRGALDLLVAEDYVEATIGPRGAKLHRSTRPFREGSDTTSSPPRPHLVPDTVPPPRPTASPPKGTRDEVGRGRGEDQLVPGTKSPNGQHPIHRGRACGHPVRLSAGQKDDGWCETCKKYVAAVLEDATP